MHASRRSSVALLPWCRALLIVLGSLPGASHASAQQLYDLQSFGVTSMPNRAFGQATAVIGDVDGDGRDDIVVGDPSAGAFLSVQTGQVQVISGATGAVIHLIDGVQPDQLGFSVARIGDLDGDGITDFAAGAPGRAPGGRVYVYSGATAAVLLTLNGTAVYGCLPGFCGVESDRFGEGVAGPGDVNADGIPDICVGAPQAVTACGTPFCGGPYRTGRVFAYSGANGALLANFPGPAVGSKFGQSLAPAGDVNGDGIPDVLAGATGTGAGTVEVLAGGTNTVLFTIPSPLPGSQFGAALASTGDLDGDGHSEFAIGAPAANVPWIATGAVTIYSGANASVIRTITLGVANDKMGRAIARVGDVDGDGFSELVVSSVNGPAGASVQSVRLVSAASGAFLQLWSGGPTYAGFGTSLAGPGNFDGDAVPDFVVGAANPYVPATPPGYIRTYSTTGTSPLMSVLGALDPFGWPVWDAHLVGDLDGDGVSDLCWAAYPNVGFSSGATRALLGAFNIEVANGGSITNDVRLAALGDVNGDQVPDVLASAQFDISGLGLGSRAFIVSGSTFQAIHTVTQSGPCTIQGTAPVCALGDQNSDGVTDFAIGFTGCTSAGSTGEVRIHSGQTGTLIRAIQNVGTGVSNALAVADAGDLNGDGVHDVMVGAPYAPNNTYLSPGEVRIFSGVTGSLMLAIPGSGSPPQFGSPVGSIRDVNGDGVRDLIASSGTGGGPPGSAPPTRVDVLSGATGALLMSFPQVVQGSKFGHAFTGLDDFDGDGAPDVAISAASESVPGHVGVLRVYSAATGALVATELGPSTPVGFGSQLEPAGDFNQDGIADLLLVATQFAPTNVAALIHVTSFAGVPFGSLALGGGCPDPLGRVPGLGATGGLPDVTNGNPTFGLLVSNLAPGAQPTLLLGASPTWMGNTLPLDLAMLGLPGCTLFVSPDVMIPLFANGAQPAAAYIPLPVPVAPAASGAWIGVQAYVPTTPGSSFPGVLTRGLMLVAY